MLAGGASQRLRRNTLPPRPGLRINNLHNLATPMLCQSAETTPDTSQYRIARPRIRHTGPDGAKGSLEIGRLRNHDVCGND